MERVHTALQVVANAHEVVDRIYVPLELRVAYVLHLGVVHRLRRKLHRGALEGQVLDVGVLCPREERGEQLAFRIDAVPLPVQLAHEHDVDEAARGLVDARHLDVVVKHVAAIGVVGDRLQVLRSADVRDGHLVLVHA